MFYKEKKPCPFDRNTGFLFYVCESVNFHTELIRLFYSYFKCLGYTIAYYCNLSCTFLDTFYCTIGRYGSNFLIAGFVCDFSGWSCFCCDLSCFADFYRYRCFAQCKSWIFNCYFAGYLYISAFSCDDCGTFAFAVTLPVVLFTAATFGLLEVNVTFAAAVPVTVAFSVVVFPL